MLETNTKMKIKDLKRQLNITRERFRVSGSEFDATECRRLYNEIKNIEGGLNDHKEEHPA